MRISEAQKRVAEVTKGIEHPRLASFIALTEEVGEVADQILKVEIYEETKDREKLKGEIADVFFQLMELANVYGVDLEKEFARKAEDIDKRAEAWRGEFLERIKKKREKHD